MPGILKIGATRSHPLHRAKQLSAGTGVPAEYALVYYHSFDDSFAAETLVHNHFATRRINESREFFEIGEDEAIEFIMKLAANRDYHDIIEVSGGEGSTTVCGDPQLARAWAEVAKTPLPWSELFASFGEDDGEGRELTDEEKGKCRELERRLIT